MSINRTMDYPSSAPHIYSTLQLEVLPHVALPLVILIAFSCPPFPGRGAAFAALITLTEYGTIISPWPPNIGSTRPMRYGITGSWLFVLPAIEKLLLHIPERDFWRIDDQKAAAKGRPREWTWGKIRWAVALSVTPRGVGWNFGSRKVNAARAQMRLMGLGKGNFVTMRLVRAALAYLALDAVVIAARKATVPESWAWNCVAIGRIAYVELLLGVSVYSTMTLQFEIAAAMAVGLNITQPEEWPPLFGNILECYSVDKVWGVFWHSYIRQPVLGFSHSIVDFLGVPSRSSLAYLIHLTTAFFISASFHTLSLSVICAGYFPVERLIFDMLAFFMAQIPATFASGLALQFYEKHKSSEEAATNKQIEKASTRFFHDLQRPSHSPIKITGYACVFSWFVFTGWWFVQPYIALGVVEWPLPFSVFSYF